MHRDALVRIRKLSFDGRAGLLEISLQLLAGNHAVMRVDVLGRRMEGLHLEGAVSVVFVGSRKVATPRRDALHGSNPDLALQSVNEGLDVGV